MEIHESEEVIDELAGRKPQRRPKNKKFRNGLAVFFSSVVILYLVFSAGYLFAKRGINVRIVPGILTNRDVNQPHNIDFSLFWDVWNKTHGEFVGNEDDQKMVYGAIDGSLAALGDPYTIFLNPEDNKKFNEEVTGQFDGIGAELSTKNGVLIIVAPIDGSPAAKAGLLSGDQILAIDGKKTDGFTTDQAVDLIRGQKGTDVTLSILRSGKQKDYKITRDTININSVTFKYQTVNKEKVAVVKISQFSNDTTDLMNQFADDCLKNGCQKIVLDLRNNPGGYLDSAIDVGSLFIKEGVVVKEVDKAGNQKVSNVTQTAKLAGIPVIVIINNGSASAAEILAGAISDHKVGTLLGEKSFGKGSVQSVEDLKNGAALKITIAKWLTPSGSAIDGIGITPQTEVKMTEDDINAGRDPQMDRALQEISK